MSRQGWKGRITRANELERRLVGERDDGEKEEHRAGQDGVDETKLGKG